jgi:phosphoribosyl 1,2-cyclic phosphate phosphodiesterase
MLVERVAEGGVTRVLIDTSPDLREQLLDVGISHLDAVVWTHAHADHLHGIDDLRVVYFHRQEKLPAYADAETRARLTEAFGYIFVSPPGSNYPPILDLHDIDGPFSVSGAGGNIDLVPFRVGHGRITALGFRIGGLAYLPDVKTIPAEVWPELEGLDIWVLDALRRDPHPSHVHLAEALEWIKRASPRRAVLTNLHNDLDYQTVAAETPEHVTPAHDGLVLTLPF